MRASPREIAALTRFARWLGWRGLKMHRYVVRERSPRLPRGYPIIWFETPGMPELALQINFAPRWAAAVYAMRYRICSGWHRFDLLYHDDDAFRAEAIRLDEWLHARWFTSLSGRRQYRRRHPECANYTWRRIRTGDLPNRVA